MRRLLLLAALPVSFFATEASADGLGVPDAGSLQVGRGGAWIARADDPMAAYFNPAGMSFQANGVHLGAHLMIQSSCFARIGEDGQPVSPGNNIPGPGAPNGPEADTCMTAVFPNPQLAAVFRPYDGLAIGVALVAPHAVGNIEWPESVEYRLPSDAEGDEPRTQPSPTRYMLVKQASIIVFPTISVSYAIDDTFSIGAGFVWGVAAANFTTFTEGLSDGADNFTNDVRAEVTANDYFIPGFVIGANWRASRRVDLGAAFRWSDAVHSNATTLRLTSRYWTAAGRPNEEPCTAAEGADCNITEREDAGSFKLNIPMEAKLGARYHHPLKSRGEVPKWAQREGEYVRDPLSEDLFDIEVDVTWSHNSAVEAVELQFDDDIAVNGINGGFVPPNGDITHNWKDVLGVRVGSDVTVIPNMLAVRAGGWFESKGQGDELLNLDFHMGFKVGVDLGATLRLGPADISLAYQHVFYGTLDNEGQGELSALSGDASTETPYRSDQPVNGGRFRQQLNEVALGATFRF